MTLAEAVLKYGPIENGRWLNETQFCSLLKIPPDLSENWLHAPSHAPTVHIYCNIEMQAPLLRALQNIRDRGLLHELKTFDGALMIRSQRGYPLIPSVHSYGLAIDINALTNVLGTPGDIPDQLAECFTSEGFIWGKIFHRMDPQHFQYLAEW